MGARAAADTYYVVPPDSIAGAVEQIENEGLRQPNVQSQYMQQSPRHNRQVGRWGTGQSMTQ